MAEESLDRGQNEGVIDIRHISEVCRDLTGGNEVLARQLRKDYAQYRDFMENGAGLEELIWQEGMTEKEPERAARLAQACAALGRGAQNSSEIK